MLGGSFISGPLVSFYQKTNVSISILTTLPAFTKIILATVLTDFLNYWIHYGMHRWNWLWKTHLHHHRITELYWFSGLRSSFSHIFLFILSRVTVGVLLFQLSSDQLLIYFAIGMLGSFYQHTNSRLNSSLLEWIFITPRVHRLHHSIKGRRIKNLGTIFSIWDRIFGTYLDPSGEEKTYQLGIPSSENKWSWKEIIGF
ncbi:MAG: sterol desaturase family protein [Bacteriovoracaceae bacterium]